MVGSTAILTLLLSAGILFQGCDSDVRCRNDDGNAVDWYILYKRPNSLSYLYMDDSTKGWKPSSKTINSPSGTVGNTLKPLFDFYNRRTEGFIYILYSDQPPDPSKAPASSYGHSKGVVMSDRDTGVWLSHSTPKFPAYRTEDFWPKSGSANAQTFMCVTYPYNEFKEIGVQLKYIHVYSYDYNVPQTFHEELQCVTQSRCYPKHKPWSSVKMLTSAEGRHFYSFAKYARFGDDLYSGLIATHVTRSLYVKSWGKLQQPLPSNCSASVPHPVYNVNEVQLPEMKPFSNTVDHSKWCVTEDRRVTCIADMNREKSQMNRGGGAVCIADVVVGGAFSELIEEHEPCERLIEERETCEFDREL